MFVNGKARSNAPQLADYLLSAGKNERIIILEVDGRPNADPAYFKDILQSMELNSELTRAKKSVYHAVIRPDPESQQDRAMTMEEWHKAAEILAKTLPFENQRRATILHELDGYFHAHVVFERYDHDHGTIIDHPFNYKAHDKARFTMERELGHKPTPQKNADQPKHKKTLTEIWRETSTGAEFITRASENGYKIAKGTDRPFRVVDENGISFNLARQLEGIKTKEIRDRLANENLMPDKEAISHMKCLRKEKQAIVQQVIKPSAKEMDVDYTITEKTVENKFDFKSAKNSQQETAEEREQMRREFIDNIKTEKEKNRHHNITRDFIISALLMLRICFSGEKLYQVSKIKFQQFTANKEYMITQPFQELPKLKL